MVSGVKQGYKCHGVGVNDLVGTGLADEVAIRKWRSMLQRCYSENYHKEKPTYKDCEVCDEWLLFSNFQKWVFNQDPSWRDLQLDKDIVNYGNKIYNAEMCTFASAEVNAFFTLGRNSDLGVGVSLTSKNTGKFCSQFSDGYGGRVYNGEYVDNLTAHKYWQKFKIKVADKLISQQHDPKIIGGLERFKGCVLYDYENDLITTVNNLKQRLSRRYK